VAGVLVTHEARLAGWADRIVFVRDGVIIDQTRPLETAESLLGSAP
jgi:putative ABC transport system ATP-binding protein